MRHTDKWFPWEPRHDHHYAVLVAMFVAPIILTLMGV